MCTIYSIYRQRYKYTTSKSRHQSITLSRPLSFSPLATNTPVAHQTPPKDSQNQILPKANFCSIVKDNLLCF